MIVTEAGMTTEMTVITIVVMTATVMTVTTTARETSIGVAVTTGMDTTTEIETDIPMDDILAASTQEMGALTSAAADTRGATETVSSSAETLSPGPSTTGVPDTKIHRNAGVRGMILIACCGRPPHASAGKSVTETMTSSAKLGISSQGIVTIMEDGLKTTVTRVQKCRGVKAFCPTQEAALIMNLAEPTIVSKSA